MMSEVGITELVTCEYLLLLRLVALSNVYIKILLPFSILLYFWVPFSWGQESNIISLLTLKIKWLSIYFILFIYYWRVGVGYKAKARDWDLRESSFIIMLFLCLQSYLILQERNIIC
jgi:hypothetical protein